jgi:chemotaxis protein MotB
MQDNNTGKEEKKPRRRVKKAKGHGGHHGGAWKVAYADFVTAMMALFLVLWLVSQADTKLKQQIANYFRSPGVFTSTKGGILSGASKVSHEPSKLTSKDDEQALFSVAQSLQKKFDTRPEFSKSKDKVYIKLTEDGLQIQVIDKADDISFEVGKANLTKEAREILEEIAQAVCELPNPIIIGGHTDARIFPSSNGYTNWELSTDRANSARRVLQEICVKPEQIRRIIGYADTDPIIPEDVYAPANRRISITVLRMNYEEKVAAETKEANSEDTSNEPVEESVNLKENNMVEKKSKKQSQKTEKVKSEEDPEKEEPKETVAEIERSGEKTGKKKPLETKLKKEGQVSVGEPDKIPSTTRSREPKSQKP